MSMISNQIKTLRELSKEQNIAYHRRIINEAADTIEALSAKLAAANMERSERYYNGGWILCEDRLPEWGTTSYLVCLENGGIFMALFLNNGKFSEISSMGTRDFCENNPVVAWQPLPKPYKSDKE